MARSPWRALSLVLAGLLAAGCSDDTLSPEETGQDSSLTEQMAAAVIETEDLAGRALEGEVAGSEPEGSSGTITIDRTFTRTVDCPLGGTIALDGELHDTFDFDTLTRDSTSNGTKTVTSCAFREDGFTLTLDGSAQWQAALHRVAGQAVGPQTASVSGSITAVRDDGKSRSCEFSIEAVRDPEAHTRTVTASLCGREFTRTVSWNPRG